MKNCSGIVLFCVLVFFPLVLSQFAGFDPNHFVISPDESEEENISAPDEDRHYVNAKPKITGMRVKTHVTNRLAKTEVISRMVNLAYYPQETVFTVVLPNTAYITGFLLVTGNKTYEAYLKSRDEAKQLYTEGVNKGQSTAHVEASARDANRFNVSVNIGPGKRAIFRLTYEQLLQRENGHYEVVINLHPGQPVRQLGIEVDIEESLPLKFVRSPSIRTGKSLTGSHTVDLAKIIRYNSSHALVRFRPNLQQQKKLAFALRSQQNKGFSGQFVVQYDVVRNVSGGEILIHDGYFIHFFSPSNLQTLPKHVVFVLDVSGSMAGEKIIQLQDAMDTILQQLNLQDVFNLVQFEAAVGIWDIASENVNTGNKMAVRANKHFIENARKIVKRLKAHGGTNILDALTGGLDLVKLHQETSISKHDPMIIFLTDGEATVGETNSDVIINKVTQLNDAAYKTPIYTLSFGTTADKKLLRKLSLKNRGFLKPIYEDSDAAGQLKNFYLGISSPELSHIEFLYTNVTNVTQTNFPFYFGGSEIVVAGEYGNGTFTPPSIRASGINGSVTFPTHIKKLAESLERHWAYLNIKQLLDTSEAVEPSEKEEFTKKALDLALKYNFVTPVSSLIVVKPNGTELGDLSDASPPEATVHKNPQCFINNMTDNYLQIESPVWDTHAKSYIYSTHNVLDATTDSDNIFIDLNGNNEMEITVTPIDEESEISQSAKYVYNFVVSLTCKDNTTEEIYVSVPLRDTNNHIPTFDNSAYIFDLLTPTLAEFNLLFAQNKIIATDIDVTNDKVHFSIGHNTYFNVEYNGTVPGSLNKKHFAQLVPKRNNTYITQPIVVQLTVKDVGKPQKKSGATLIIRPPVLPTPIFTKSLYTGSYYGNGTIILAENPQLVHEEHVYYDIAVMLTKGSLGDYYLTASKDKFSDEISINYGHIGNLLYEDSSVHHLYFELKVTYTDSYSGVSKSGKTAVLIEIQRPSDLWDNVINS